jgi:hypothetical protein
VETRNPRDIVHKCLISVFLDLYIQSLSNAHGIKNSDNLARILFCVVLQYITYCTVYKDIQTYDMQVPKSCLGSCCVDLTHVLTLQIREKKTFNFFINE